MRAAICPGFNFARPMVLWRSYRLTGHETTSDLRFRLRNTCAELARNLTSQNSKNMNVFGWFEPPNCSGCKSDLSESCEHCSLDVRGRMLVQTCDADFQAAAYLPEDYPNPGIPECIVSMLRMFFYSDESSTSQRLWRGTAPAGTGRPCRPRWGTGLPSAQLAENAWKLML